MQDQNNVLGVRCLGINLVLLTKDTWIGKNLRITLFVSLVGQKAENTKPMWSFRKLIVKDKYSLPNQMF